MEIFAIDFTFFSIIETQQNILSKVGKILQENFFFSYLQISSSVL